MRMVIPVTLCILVSPALLRSEVVTFRNGDQLTGEWVRIADGRLTFKSEAMGAEMPIPVSNILSFSSSRAAVVMLKGGGALRGGLALGSSGDWYVATESGTRVVPAEAVVAIYPQEIYEPRSPERSGKPWQNWHGAGSLGYSLVRGDLQAGTLSVGLDGSRLQPDLPGLPSRFRTNYHLATLFANTRNFSGARVSANSFSSSLRQDLLFTPSNFVFVLGQLDHDQSESLDLRQTYGTGLGRDLIHRSRAMLDFVGGTTIVKERFQTGARRDNFEGLVGEKLKLRLSEHLGLTEYVNFYPSLTDTGEYRMDMTSTLSAHVAKWLSMNTGFTDRFLSRPLAGHMGNEFVVTTGLGFRF